jgi:hypothetical protein
MTLCIYIKVNKSVELRLDVLEVCEGHHLHLVVPTSNGGIEETRVAIGSCDYLQIFNYERYSLSPNKVRGIQGRVIKELAFEAQWNFEAIDVDSLVSENEKQIRISVTHSKYLHFIVLLF